jgi:hypothetical protein
MKLLQFVTLQSYKLEVRTESPTGGACRPPVTTR